MECLRMKFAFLLLLGCFCCFDRISALSVTVHKVECVYEYVFYDGDSVSGYYVAIDHEVFWSPEHPGIDFEVTSPHGNVVYSSKGMAAEKYEFKAPTHGMYKFCFVNPTGTPESISFYIHTGHIAGDHELAKDEHLNPINVRISKLKEALESVVGEQRYLKAREMRHRHTNESTRRRLIFYTITEYVAFACVSGLQVAYIRRLFSKSISYNRI